MDPKRPDVGSTRWYRQLGLTIIDPAGDALYGPEGDPRGYETALRELERRDAMASAPGESARGTRRWYQLR